MGLGDSVPSVKHPVLRDMQLPLIREFSGHPGASTHSLSEVFTVSPGASPTIVTVDFIFESRLTELRNEL